MELLVRGVSVRVKDNLVCITDIARISERETKDSIRDWLRNRKTLQYLEAWEGLNNPNFKQVDFNLFKDFADYSYNKVSISKYIEMTSAIGIQVERGRYGGTYTHYEIAFEFATWLNPAFKVFFFREWVQMKLIQNKAIEFAIARAEDSVANTNTWLKIAKESLNLPAEEDKNLDKK